MAELSEKQNHKSQMLIDKKMKLKVDILQLISKIPNSFEVRRNVQLVDQFVNDFFMDERSNKALDENNKDFKTK